MARALLVLLLAAGCGAASGDPGLDALLQVSGAQYVPGAMPADTGGPEVIAMTLSAFTVFPGARDQPLLGTVAEAATGVAFGLDGDRGYWVLPADVPDTETPTLPSFAVAIAFARALSPGPVTLVGRAIDAGGRFGPRRELVVTVAPLPEQRGHLVFVLAWDRLADLDLHVVDPTGAEIWANKPSADPLAGAAVGQLDLDSNGSCVLDGRNREYVVYETTAPPGRYVVRVDTYSLCAETVARWRAQAFVAGELRAEAVGISVDSDTIGPHGRGAGRTAFELTLP